MLFRSIPSRDIQNHLHYDAAPERNNFIASADLGLERFKDSKNNWVPSKIKPEHFNALLDAYMAGTAADEVVSGIHPSKNVGNTGDYEDANSLLKSMGIDSAKDRKAILDSRLEKVKDLMRKNGIDDIIKEEFAKGKEPGLHPAIMYGRQRLAEITRRVKEIINGQETGKDVDKTSDTGVSKSPVLRKPKESDQGPSVQNERSETGRPPIGDEDLVTEKRHMPGHQIGRAHV